MSPSSPEDGPSEPSGAPSASTTTSHEPLACATAINQSAPAQVEGLLRTVGRQRVSQPARSDGPWTEGSSPIAPGGEPSQPERPPRDSPRGRETSWKPSSPAGNPSDGDNASPGELLSLGQFESLPPFEMIEELHTIFFATQQHFLPIIHPSNYLRAFHSPPHMRPPLSLQYAIWTTASNGHPKYGCYHDALYRRARQYLESDELKGHGEHFITIAHAQAWALVATDEARCLMFTKASMSCAKSVRLAGMMGLHRLDDTHPDDVLPMAPMIAPARNWAELEERRRLFWGGFCIDSYASISAGWPTLIDITTHLPASDDAFHTGIEEKSFTLRDAFRGSSYSIFAGNVIICHVFTRLLKHAHRPLPDDCPQDPEFGRFWKRHRELDNMLSDGFLFLPEPFRLPRNVHNPTAVQANLNLHAAVICLHIAAREKADQFKLAGIRQASRTRALTAAQEIIDILRASKDVTMGYRGPLMALSLYFAASVYIAQAKDNLEDCNTANLEYIVECMNSTARHHAITQAYLRQLLLDIERNGIPVSVDHIRNNHADRNCNPGVPLIAQMRHTQVQSPLPGRLPLDAPVGTILKPDTASFNPCAPPNFTQSYYASDDLEGPASKRMRTSAGPAQVSASACSRSGRRRCRPSRDSAPDLFEYTGGGWSYTTKYMTNPAPTPLPPPHSRTSPPEAMAAAATFGFDIDDTATTTSPTATTTTTTTATANHSQHDVPDLGDLGDLNDLGIFDLDQPWSVTESLYALLDMSAVGDDLADPSAAGPSQAGSSSSGGGGGGGGGGGMNPWLNNAGAGAGGGSSSGGGGGGAWDTGGEWGAGGRGLV
ncbi:hypothetical protein CHGG_03349 [Chaetomium globosum CBS 148.51]|uniref:Xylanolytic transcriptional activator regulatory domain-containing protein n=1 Tax=Chaetomium globosum (strain ATCC 6205 / CBS 148.51 / DSM 1962 / NBRC 6347 / NRRL 1970) TaxID=306901 RepID=Q2H8V5_CHAGB|nr:uncharacterized protein CHGG_03349 [Chaetomium globosum CBS 148.51]EAQ91414.1 hypothetical protein CHGG_03349 [Chaetomium globosum CBS 148.51]